jgi:primosomal protein N' (replication factor Y)
MTRSVSVALPLPIRREFSYRLPETMETPAPGTRVRVPFGERVLTGVVTGPGPAGDGAGLREVLEALDIEPALTPELLSSAARVAERFFASTGEVLRSALPARLPASGAVRYRITRQGALARASGSEAQILDRLSGGEALRVTDLTVEGRLEALRSLEQRGWIRPTHETRARRPRLELAWAPARLDAAERTRLLGRSRLGPSIVGFLEAIGRPATTAELRQRVGATPAVLRALAARGVLLSFEQSRRDEAGQDARVAPLRPAGSSFVLTPEQDAAVRRVVAAVAGRRSLAALLQGVTGSGKTEVYLRGIAAALEIGRGAVWLVPEIALTPFFARRLRKQFGDRATVLHSGLSEGERGRAWRRVRSGEASVVIGPRSAAFAPVSDPGIFIVDEEHDASYKQRESPRYDAREVAAIRARANGAVLLFASATPSLEAYHAAREGRLELMTLTARVEDRELPRVEIVDLRRERARPEEKGVPLFSAPLVERLREVFAAGEQAILLQPRRGFAPFLLCRDCGFDFRCSQCSVRRTVHDRGRTLVCHYCGQRTPRPARCPDCAGALLEEIGAGTERVADRFAELFPGVPHAILDRDTARRRGAAAVLEEMASARISCLIGTQMVAKGHDFPGVTAVGVLSADTLLNFPDFRSAEKTHQLVSQVAGRAGRGERPGTVHVQTFHPQHPAIRLAASHDLDGFARQELDFRRSFFYPPFCELASVLVSSADRERAERAAAGVGAALRSARSSVRLSGPAPAPLERLKGRWRFQILLRAADRRGVLAALADAVPERAPAGVRTDVDVDPQDLM